MGKIVKKSLVFMILCMSLCLWMSIPASAAARTGGIRIGVKSYEEDSTGKRSLMVRQPELMPNEHISYVIAVENQESDAWIRLQVAYSSEGNQVKNVSVDDSWLTGIGEDWVKKGEYWYYLRPLTHGETVDFCKGMRVPDISYLPEGMVFQISAKAEAVQAANVIPDFEIEDPFTGIQIEENAETSDLDENVTGFEVRYSSGADTIVKADGLFSDIDELMPGDIENDTVMICNQNRFKVRVALKEVGDQVDDIVLKALRMAIYRGGKVIYDGALADRSLKNGIILGEFPANCEEELEFQVWLPAEVKNETAFHAIKVAFAFSVDYVKEQRNQDSQEKEKDVLQKGTIHPCPDPGVEDGYKGGEWKLIDDENHIWEYHFADGSKAADGWLYLYNPYSQDADKYNWFCFDEKGIMQFGWIKTENENWYFCHEVSDGNLGKLKRGWHHDLDDERDYYLDPVTGIMQTGWRQIEGKYYYFTLLEETKRQNWFWNTEIGRWIYDFLGYRTYGSMYKNEKTPDGYWVDSEGIWNEEI